jgi:hypothetical protein
MDDRTAFPLPPVGDVERMARALGWRPSTFRHAAHDRGASDTAARWIVTDGRDPAAGGRSAFVKIGATDLTAQWTRTEHRHYERIRGPFMPRMMGFDDDGQRPALALEDLSDAEWPPPWTDDRVAGVLDAFQSIRTATPPRDLPREEPDDGADWRAVAADPEPFLALGLCSAAWLEGALPRLIEASANAPLAGDALVHLDVRSDNLCFRDGRAIVIDWNHARLANPDLDVAFWLPSLAAEGGPLPESILPDAPELAAWVSGFFCSRAGGEPFPEAPHVRPLQLAQSRTALPWVARALGLPPP